MIRFHVFCALALTALAAGCGPIGQPERRPAPLPKPAPEPARLEAPRVDGPTRDNHLVQFEAPPLTQFVPSAKQPPPQRGNFGYRPNPAATREFLRGLEKPTLREAAPQLFEPRVRVRATGTRADSPTLLYRALYEVRPGWKVGRQGIGDCVSWGWAHGCDIALAVDKATGKTGEWHPAATEAIYGGSRVEAAGKPEGGGGWSDGSYGAAAAKWVSGWGVVYRRPYEPLDFDLTSYSAQRAKQWGNWGCGGQGDSGRLDEIAKNHPAAQVALVRSFEEAAAAIESGYPVPVCSMRGFASSRDEDGFAAPSGSWAHCMCFVAVRHDRPGLLCLNSWGTDWIGGPKWPEDMPEGAFWVDADVATRMLSGGDSFAVSHIKGFPRRKLDRAKGW